ncbi:hypothetical protein [Staphylococcus aureus]|uniref:hypothetical protein n=1 Tax=Staphylococcus aureus TaxID=1280 RepID=UPI003364FE57
MYKTTETLVNNKSIEIIRENEDRYIIYNKNNDRTIIGNQEVFEYLIDHQNITEESPLYNFIEKKKKFNILEFNILSFNINSKYINKVSSFSRITTNNIVVLLALFISIVYIMTNVPLKVPSINNQNIFVFLGAFWLSELFLTVVHELSHFYYYQRNFKSNYTKFGVTIRYISLILFFTSVPFIRILEKKEKKELILAGIKTQISINGLLVITICIAPILQDQFFIQIFLIVNLLSVLVNIIPFFKLDGYWYISSVLNQHNYMVYYYKMLNKKAPFNFVIFVLGTINILLIIVTILFTIINIAKLFI